MFKNICAMSTLTTEVHEKSSLMKDVTLENSSAVILSSSLDLPGQDITGLKVGEYTISNIISQNGSHGLVVECVDNAGAKWAMKIERSAEEMAVDNLAMNEISNHPMNRDQTDLHVPRLHEGFIAAGKNISVMDLLGPDLFTLQTALRTSHISLKSRIQIGISLLYGLEEIHRAGWLHLSMKPVNLCIGGTATTRHKVYYVDFGRAEKFRLEGVHRPLGRVSRAGHEKYSSVWFQYDITPSRRDDIMSLGLLLKQLEGNVGLPWINTGYTTMEEWLINMEPFRDHPELKPYKKLVVEAWKMWYIEEPKYEKLRQYFRDYAKKKGIELDGKYEWDVLYSHD